MLYPLARVCARYTATLEITPRFRHSPGVRIGPAMALAEALLRSKYDALIQEGDELACATAGAWDELWELAQSPTVAEGDLQVCAEAYGMAALREALKLAEAEAALIEWRRAR